MRENDESAEQTSDDWFGWTDSVVWPLCPGDHAPRDTTVLTYSRDFLFFALLLKNWRKEFRYAGVLPSGMYVYVDRAGNARDVHTLQPAAAAGAIGRLYRRSTVKKHLRRYWVVRDYVSGRKPTHDYSLDICNRRLIHEGMPDGEALRRFCSEITNPPLPQDPLVADPASYIRKDLYGDHADGRTFFCPVDGPVSDMRAVEMISSDSSWRWLIGRHYRYLVCPGCLGVLRWRLVVMN